ncbi:MAG: TIGR00730 family Rossman fold protein [Dehalococcoidia bacterium]
MPTVRSVAVYCASSSAVPEEFLDLAADTGAAIAAQRWRLVYGGASIGMMGACAEAAIASGGDVLGVITRDLVSMEVAHEGLPELRVVDSMHERKLVMTDACDAFLVLPGGFGTLDEAFEAITWKQLGAHAKPIVVLNHAGFYDGLLAFLESASNQRFIRPEGLRLFEVANSVASAVRLLRTATPSPPLPNKWWRREP